MSLEDDASYALHIKEAASALRDGKLVAFPTETVYGLGANADDTGAIARLYEVKQRPKEKQLSLLIYSLEGVKLWVQIIPPNAKLLMDEFWPGPLTIILPGIGGSEVGLRFPDSKVAQDIVRLADVPVAATSANISGMMTPPISAEQVIGGLGGRIELVIDGGTTLLQAPSTVVRVTSTDVVEVIRVGVISRKKVYDCFKQEQEI
ncbi:MAG: L-threonylcarbamoyladenylate synthase [Candidatus Brocadiales bacterium]